MSHVPGAINLRFAVGARVECFLDDWQRGTVLQHWYTQPSFEAGMAAPYQVALDNGKTVHTPKDDDSCVRALTNENLIDAMYQFAMPPEEGPYPALRFGIGQRVVCKYASTSTAVTWEEGTVEALFWHGGIDGDEQAQGAIPHGMCAPYQVLLDGAHGTLICAPSDTDISIRASAARKPSRSGPIRNGPAGDIDPRMPPALKAEAYVDLILAPGGQSMLAGESALIHEALGQRGFNGPLLGCDSDELEMVAAVVGLTQIGQGAVREAMLRRAPESLAALAAFMAFTPPLIDGRRDDDDVTSGWTYEGTLKDPMCTDPDELRVRACEFTSCHPSGQGAPYDCKETYHALAPPQASKCYCRVLTACCNVLLTVCDPHEPGATQAVAQLQASPAFVPLVQRLMELVARWSEAGDSYLRAAASVPALGGSLGYGARVPQLALWALAKLCSSTAAPRVRWLLRAHRVHQRRYDAEKQQWVPVAQRDSRADGQACVRCGISVERLKKCAGCMQRLYCSPDCQTAEWEGHKPECKRIKKEAKAGAPPAGFLGVLLDALGGKLANASEEDKQHARVVLAVTRAEPFCALTDDRGRQMLPPLPAVPAVPAVRDLAIEEIEEAFDAVADGQSDFEALTDELAACANEGERAVAMLFFLDVRLLPPGRRLLIHGLASKPELNGTEAVLAGPRPQSDEFILRGTLRYPVRVIEGAGNNAAAMLLRPRNLRLLGDDDDDSDEDVIETTRQRFDRV